MCLLKGKKDRGRKNILTFSSCQLQISDAVKGQSVFYAFILSREGSVVLSTSFTKHQAIICCGLTAGSCLVANDWFSILICNCCGVCYEKARWRLLTYSSLQKKKRKERGRNQKEKELLYHPEVLTLVIRKKYGRIVIQTEFF